MLQNTTSTNCSVNIKRYHQTNITDQMWPIAGQHFVREEDNMHKVQLELTKNHT